MTDPTSISAAIAALVEKRDLDETQAAACMEELMTGAATEAQIGAFLAALRMKGETVDEITGMARVMREKCARVEVDGPLLDTCGTGGDASGSFNVSTCAAFVAAGAGARVAKHGNRAMSSKCGSADVLEALGANINLAPEQVKRCIETTGMGFMFAQAFHPSMKHVGPARREIGVRTIFNLLGPMTNPANASRRLLGVASRELLDVIPTVFQRLGVEHALVVHGDDGLDEVSITGATTVAELAGSAVRTYRIAPEDCGLRVHVHAAADLKGGAPEENAAAIRAVLGGAPGALRDFTLINAGAALVAWGTAPDIAAGAKLAAESIDSGAASKKLEAFVAATQVVA
jgi:anthranilate phosphoribosyltransferase